MRLDLGFLSIEWRQKPNTAPRRGRRPPPLTPWEKMDRAATAARWILERHLDGLPNARNDRPNDMTHQGWTHGRRMLESAGLIINGMWVDEPPLDRQFRRTPAGMREDLWSSIDHWRLECRRENFVAPW